MIALAAFLALAQERGDDVPLVSREGAGRAHWRVAAESIEVGEPFEAVLVVPHARADEVALDAASLDLDPSWVALDPPRPLAAAAADWLTPAESAFAWTIASLEAGERELPHVAVEIAPRDGPRFAVEIDPAKATFEGVLGPSEDAPRAPRGFAPIEPVSKRAFSPLLLVAGAAAMVAAAALVLWLALRRRRARPQPPPTFEQRLAELERRDLDARDSVREIHYELTRLVRGELDARSGRARDALTDDEWLRAVAEALDSERVRELEALMRASAEVKYGAHAPTPWAVRETLERARRVAASKRPPAEVAP